MTVLTVARLTQMEDSVNVLHHWVDQEWMNSALHYVIHIAPLVPHIIVETTPTVPPAITLMPMVL